VSGGLLWKIRTARGVMLFGCVAPRGKKRWGTSPCESSWRTVLLLLALERALLLFVALGVRVSPLARSTVSIRALMLARSYCSGSQRMGVNTHRRARGLLAFSLTRHGFSSFLPDVWGRRTMPDSRLERARGDSCPLGTLGRFQFCCPRKPRMFT